MDQLDIDHAAGFDPAPALVIAAGGHSVGAIFCRAAWVAGRACVQRTEAGLYINFLYVLLGHRAHPLPGFDWPRSLAGVFFCCLPLLATASTRAIRRHVVQLTGSDAWQATLRR